MGYCLGSNRFGLRQTCRTNPGEVVRQIPRIELLLLQARGGQAIEAEEKRAGLEMRLIRSVCCWSAWTNIPLQPPLHPWSLRRRPRILHTRSYQGLGCWGNFGEAREIENCAFSGVSYTSHTRHRRRLPRAQEPLFQPQCRLWLLLTNRCCHRLRRLMPQRQTEQRLE